MADKCTGCGFDYAGFGTEQDRAGDAVDRLVPSADDLGQSLMAATDPRLRPEPETWSPIEYACHVRDVLLVQRERALLTLRSDGTAKPGPMGRDERGIHDGYLDQDPESVARQVGDAALMLSNVFNRLDDEAWSRTLWYTWPDGAERTLRWLAVHALHEVDHHLWDVRTQVESA